LRLRAESGAELIATRDVAKGDVVAVFGKTATLWTSTEVHEFQELIDATNDDPCGTLDGPRNMKINPCF